MALIITGHPRSGTTMLMGLCNGHPQITLTKEVGNFGFLGRSFPDYCRRILNRWYLVGNRWSFELAASHHRKLVAVGNMRFILRFLWGVGRCHEQRVTHQAVEASLRNIYPESLIVGDKWPFYMSHLDKLAPANGLKVLVIYRDCRDVTSSFLLRVRTSWRQKEWAANVNTAEKIAAKWVRRIDEMEKHAHDIHIVRYEDLVFAPQQTMRTVGQWLDVDSQLFPIERVRHTSIGKYKNGLSNSELEAVMRTAGPTMARLGYG